MSACTVEYGSIPTRHSKVATSASTNDDVAVDMSPGGQRRHGGVHTRAVCVDVPACEAG